MKPFSARIVVEKVENRQKIAKSAGAQVEERRSFENLLSAAGEPLRKMARTAAGARAPKICLTLTACLKNHIENQHPQRSCRLGSHFE